MKGFGGGLQQLMKQANQMQMKIKKVQEEFAGRIFEAASGGGAVTVKVTGDNRVNSIIIKPDVMTSGDVEMLQDLIMTATNEALKTARTSMEQEMQKVTGGMVPGLF